jgi:phage terminase small subunit
MAACEAWYRVTQARKQIDAEGLTVADRFGQAKSHPPLTTERDARGQFLMGMKQLSFDYDDFTPRWPGRPPESY